MQKKLLSLALTFLVFGFGAMAQIGTGTLKGKVTDDKGEPLPFANVVVELNGTLVTGTLTDFDGNYTIKPISPGRFTVKASIVGYTTQQVNNVQVSDSKITFQDFKMVQGIELGAATVIEYEVPLIKQDGGSETTITSEDIVKMPGRTAESVATTVAGVYSQDGEVGSIRGSRGEATDTYIDGVRVRGSSAIPQSAIEQVTVVTGGLPAQFGDATGGVISITTKGPSRNFFGGAEVVTSQYLDNFGYNLGALNLSGPLIMVKDKANEGQKKPLFGFFLSAEGTYQKDPDPSAIGSYKVKDDILKYLEQNPIRPSGLVTGGSYLNSQFIHRDQVEKIAAKENVARKDLNLSGKIDLSTSGTTNLTFGGSMALNERKNYDYDNALFNYVNNGQVINNTIRAFGRFTQRFNAKEPKEGKKSGGISNAYYTLQVDYTKVLQTVQDPDHKDNLFNYGYVGKFVTHTIPTYGFGIDTTTGLFGQVLNGFADTLVEFTPSDINPTSAAYTSQFYAQNPEVDENYENLFQIQNKGGRLNGQLPNDVYGLWRNTGYEYNRYSKQDNTSLRVTALGSVDLKNHAFTLGFEYEQRTDRNVTYNPAGLWTLARQLTNFHISEIDVTNPQPVFVNGVFEDTINYPRFFNGDDQAFFDYNLRQSLGLQTNGLDYIDLDSYDPSQLNINFFSADELLNNGNNYVSYYGFDHTGKKLSGNPSFDDFFTAKDEFGNYKREIGAFQPTYLAGYIQDKFAFKDLIFNVGVRVDRYDANQKVLKDPFSLFETKKAGEVSQIGGNDVTHPSNIGNDYVVYVNDINSPTAIVGYRNDRTWYNAEGVEISDPTVLRTGSGIAPYLVDPSDNVVSSKAFKDYQPQTNIMPRISFSFPISEDALFFAHYDVLTKRPVNDNGLDAINRLDPIDYLFIENRNVTINNPDLKPEKTIDYELGFQQKISNSSAIKFSAFYRELRNLIQVTQNLEAYPRTYRTYGNLDFGTVKGLSLSYDLRRTGNMWMRASYTLQFADGTGSNTTTGINLINSGFGNLRTIQPFSFDQRHNIVVTLDYRFKSGAEYNGPKIGKLNIFSNTGLNVIARAGSGTPYTRQLNATNEGTIGGGTTSRMDGSINGSRLPWQFRLDLRLDKDIALNFGKKEGKKKPANLTVYLQVLNVLNTKNIISVYRKTGNPDDDGYLAAAEFQNNIASQNDEQSYRDLYALKINNPDNYSMPRRIRLGLLFNF
ncbi:MAG: hypothetical protein POELPBGB_00640 [Bacteroidia bacterium]|nr:hypothetical protein [Bacteroidia bacterium]